MLLRYLVKKLLIPWLRARALVLPDAEREKLARKLGVSEDTVITIETVIRERIISAIEEVVK
ncbi:MAG: hypothetical protein C4335_06545 [Armatimonadota bacterium]